jgi:hypothetical protein
MPVCVTILIEKRFGEENQRQDEQLDVTEYCEVQVNEHNHSRSSAVCYSIEYSLIKLSVLTDVVH